MARQYRIGLIGYGFIGRSLHEALKGSAVEVARVYARTSKHIAGLADGISTTDPEEFVAGLDGLDLVVEAAHAEVSVLIGERILTKTSYMPCSVVALADDQLRTRLIQTAKQAGTVLFLPHGAVVGMDNLLEARAVWSSARITFRKPPASISSGLDVQADETLLFDGSVRDIAAKFPRSVNAMVACALATVGLDGTTARMIADSRIGNVLRGEFEFTGHNGSRLTIIKEEPAAGVSGVGMTNSIKASVFRALGLNDNEAVFV
jgi:aspartate dehydrogenase